MDTLLVFIVLGLLTVNMNFSLVLDDPESGSYRYGDLAFVGGQCPHNGLCGIEPPMHSEILGCNSTKNDKISLLELNAKNYLGRVESWVGTIIFAYTGIGLLLWLLMVVVRHREEFQKEWAGNHSRARRIYRSIAEVGRQELRGGGGRDAKMSRSGPYITIVVMILVICTILPMNIIQQMKSGSRTDWISDSWGSPYEPSVNGTPLFSYRWLPGSRERPIEEFPGFWRGATPDQCRAAQDPDNWDHWETYYWNSTRLEDIGFVCDDLVWLTWGNSTRWTDCFAVKYPGDRSGRLREWLTSKTNTVIQYISVL